MKKRFESMFDRVAPKRQQNWDWRAAANFICGGAGSGLMVFLALATLSGFDLRPAALVGLALVGLGLTCVWFEIGRPLRALNVFRHIATSWMTREASVAPLLFASGSLAILFPQPALFCLAGAFGLAFLYSQARILNADKGIPVWRHPLCLAMIVATGLAEGAALALLAVPQLVGGFPNAVAGLMLLVLIGRLLVWKAYLVALTAGAVPIAALRVLIGFDARFVMLGHVLPAALVVADISGIGVAWMNSLAAVMVVAGGWMLKYTLVRRAAFTQGFAIPHLPVRGRGVAGPAVKPGWGQSGS
jgi:phenylacetyl-CoA:acceptor oxidoreductase subunit 2